MAEALYINDKKLLTAKEAGDLVGFTSDYVTKLAREKKIEAEQIGKQWYIEAESLKLFSIQSKKIKEARKQQLREERVAERVKVATTELPKTLARESKEVRKLAVVEAAIVFLCIGLVGEVAQLAYEEKVSLTDLTQTVSEFTSYIGAAVATPEAGITETALLNQSADSVTSEVVEPADQSDAASAGIVVLDGDVTEDEVASVRESFSDEVEVVFEGTDTGVVTPVFKSGFDADDYRFLLVPVNEADE